MKKPYLYNLCIKIFHDHKAIFAASFITAATLPALNNKLCTLIAIIYFSAFITLTSLGAVSYYIYKKPKQKNRTKPKYDKLKFTDKNKNPK